MTAHEPDACDATVNCAGELVADAGVTTATTPQPPALAVIGPEYPGSLAVTVAVCPGALNASAACDNTTAPLGDAVGAGVGVAATNELGAGELPPPPHAHSTGSIEHTMKKRRNRRVDMPTLPGNAAHEQCTNPVTLRGEPYV